MDPLPGFVEVTRTGIRLRVRLTPRGGRERIEGAVAEAGGGARLAVRVAAPPVEGEANAALLRCLARALGVARGDVALSAGAASRLKTVEVTGEPAALAARAAALAAGAA